MRDRCNICHKTAKLTWDHVPPRGVIRRGSVQVDSLLRHLSRFGPTQVIRDETAEISPERAGYFSQNGLKFRTICSRCNNDLLGGKYDRELIRIAALVANFAVGWHARGQSEPATLLVEVRTHLLVRAVVGHMLATVIPPNDDVRLPSESDSGFYRELQRYFLDESLPIPQTAQIFYWPFISEQQAVIHGLGISERGHGRFVVGDLLKFFPIAFYLVDRNVSSLELTLPSVIGDGCSDMNCIVKLAFNFRLFPEENWPEVPTSDHVSLLPLNSSSIVTPR